MNLVADDQCKELEFYKADVSKIYPDSGHICRPNTGQDQFNADLGYACLGNNFATCTSKCEVNTADKVPFCKSYTKAAGTKSYITDGADPAAFPDGNKKKCCVCQDGYEGFDADVDGNKITDLKLYPTDNTDSADINPDCSIQSCRPKDSCALKDAN